MTEQTDAEWSATVRKAEYTFDELMHLRRVAQRLSDAITDRAAIVGLGRGWQREMDADAEHLAALKALRELLANGALPHPGKQHDFRTTCRLCGEPGTLFVAILGPDEAATITPIAGDAKADTNPLHPNPTVASQAASG